MRGQVALIVAFVVSVGACGSPSLTAAGIVTDIRSRSLVDVESFTLRTKDGQTMTFALGPLELDGGAFDAGHLRSHMATVQAVAVAYRIQDGQNVAYRLVDAPWLQP